MVRREIYLIGGLCQSVPWGWMLGSLVLVTDINYLDDDIGGMISKFVDVTNIGSMVESEEGCLTL